MRGKRRRQQKEAADVRLNEVLGQIQGDYFLDYALFTGSMREYTVRALEQTLKAETPASDDHKRMFMLAVYREQYTAYEDLGAFLNGFLINQESPRVPPLKSIFSYNPFEVRLDALFKRFEIATGDDLISRLRLLQWIPRSWVSLFPSNNIEKVLRRMCSFFVLDCTKTQTEKGVVAFNKLKHGLMFIPNARRFRPDWLDGPGILFQSGRDQPEWEQNPVTVYQIPLTDELIEARLQAVHFLETGLRLLSVFYVAMKYPEVLRRRGMSEQQAFQHPYLQDVIAIAQQSSEQPWDGNRK